MARDPRKLPRPTLGSQEDFDNMVITCYRHLIAFAERPYWSRLWIVQVFIKPTNPRILCGMDNVPLEDLSKLSYLARGQSPLIVNCEPGFEEVVKYASHCRQVGVALSGMNKIFMTRTATRNRLTREASIALARVPNQLDIILPSAISADLGIIDLMETFGQYHCADVHDRVYGLLSLTRSPSQIRPLYDQSATELAFKVIRNDLLSGLDVQERSNERSDATQHTRAQIIAYALARDLHVDNQRPTSTVDIPRSSHSLRHIDGYYKLRERGKLHSFDFCCPILIPYNLAVEETQCVLVNPISSVPEFGSEATVPITEVHDLLTSLWRSHDSHAPPPSCEEYTAVSHDQRRCEAGQAPRSSMFRRSMVLEIRFVEWGRFVKINISPFDLDDDGASYGLTSEDRSSMAEATKPDDS